MSNEMDHANIALMQRFYDAIFAGDWAGVEQQVSNDLVIQEAAGLPYAGEYRGMGGLQTVFGKVMGYWDDLSIEVKAITSGGDTAVGLLQFNGTSKATQKKVSMPIAEVARIENGRIASIHPFYWDTKTLCEVAGA